jgi:hypothetical protein
VRDTSTSVAQGDCSGSAACFPARTSVPWPMTKRTGIVDIVPALRVSAGSTSPLQLHSFASKARVVERAYRLVVLEVGVATHGGSDGPRTRHEKKGRNITSWCEESIATSICNEKEIGAENGR